ncbi:MAG: N-acetyl sugar amidotransferase, partial [Desulfamplus sp.]|nr:N-acetyl sugar amidotransferase [Desulfamplus sp.]
GKDSIFQLHVITQIYKLNPLAVTFSHNWYTDVGLFNLRNSLEKMDVDHIMFTPKRSLVNRLARKSIHKVGDACWHCHMGVETFPLQVAVKWRIPLVIYGESPAEHSGRACYAEPTKFDHDFFVQHSAKCTPEKMVGDDYGCTISKRELCPFISPPVEDLEKVGVSRIFLGDYMFWDAERQTEFVIKEYGWQENDVEGTYKRYKSVECIMPGMHDYTKFLKRGFGRGTDFANQDVRAGLLTREEGFELAKQYDCQRPGAMDIFLKETGMTEEEVVKACKKLRKGKAKLLP